MERKAALLQQHDDACENATSDGSNEEPLLSGYSFVNVAAITAMVAPFLRLECHRPSLELKETSADTSLQFVVACGGCGDIVRVVKSPLLGSSCQSKLPMHLAVATKYFGISLTELRNLFGG